MCWYRTFDTSTHIVGRYTRATKEFKTRNTHWFQNTINNVSIQICISFNTRAAVDTRCPIDHLGSGKIMHLFSRVDQNPDGQQMFKKIYFTMFFYTLCHFFLNDVQQTNAVAAWIIEMEVFNILTCISLYDDDRTSQKNNSN